MNRFIASLLYSSIAIGSTSMAFAPSISQQRHCESLQTKSKGSYISSSYFTKRASAPSSPMSFHQLNLFKKGVGSDSPPIRFLGKGKRAVIRPGVVLVAPVHEYNHFLMNSAVFVHAIGVDEYGEHVTRGVIIDHPTAFTMGEMGGGSVYGTLAHNTLFQGGDFGNDSAILLHSYGEAEGATDTESPSSIDCGDMIGTSGIFEGGVHDAMDLADEGLVDPERFKFFFNYVQFTDKELESMLEAADSDGDAWASMEVPSRVILENSFTRGDAWSYLRNQMRKLTV